MSNLESFPVLRAQLIRIAFHQLGDRHAAEDVAQETLTRIIESRKAFTSPAHLTGWAVTTTKNLCADQHRQNNRLGSHDRAAHGWTQAADQPSLSRELVASILEALHQMPPRQAAVLLACARLGSADRTALAAATGETEHAVRNYLHRGRAALRSKLAAAGQGAFGLLPLRTFLRAGAHRRAWTAGLLIPALALLTALLHLPFWPRPPAASRLHPAQRAQPLVDRSTAVDSFAGNPAARGSAQRGTTAGSRSAGPAPAGAATWQNLLAGAPQVCAGNSQTVRTGTGGCGWDTSKDSQIGVQTPVYAAGIAQSVVRCGPVPKVPVLFCRDPTTHLITGAPLAQIWRGSSAHTAGP